ncbi:MULTISPECIES: radical SAM/SPASM protein FxsBH, inactivated beta-hydroxylase extension form [Streptomyces]|uniref:FxsB family radical SAM/SPASM domain protein n=1 Tax=Streptomyces dengpaensis TaxID=2049881 RepID=A0ABM6SWE0_9ACTN|nr:MULTISPECIES: radical SAM/SPASM protein FxsB, inactivated metallohydrolase extension form [Streptomyces]AVH58897.1 FxsB family radical SAM/SPASM domain protein [Streptomyces dengpaensis]PIB11055.1 FxsB family radical SAM/SPASM domain protein [Streptomyces sp. HG99]
MKLQQLVLKIHSRCDLACDHCYVYEHADQSWKGRPTFISEETLGKVARRFADYAEEQKLASVSVILHGGEPLLVGPIRMRNICAELTRAITPVTALDLRIHTNGVQLNTRHLDVFKEFGVRVSISLDGDRAANDRHRRDRRRRSSYDRVLRAIRLLRTPEYRHLYSGLLCTVDVANDPVAVHDALAALRPPRIDYLLPHSTWDSPPLRPANSPTEYADWLLKIFDRWDRQGRTVEVRTFESVLSTLRGGPSLTEAMGLAPSDLAVVETDGSFEQADSLKTAYDGAPSTGYDVFRHSFAEFARHPGVRARQLGLAGVSATCRRCPVIESCGGGLYAHRYSNGSGFDNPSVFCSDLRAFVDGVAERITEHALSPAVRDSDELRFAQVELVRHLIAVVAARHAGEADWDEVWRAFLDLDGMTDGTPDIDEVLAHPYLHTTLKHCLHGRVTTPEPLASAVVAIAARARADLKLTWDQPAPELHLPTLGTLALAGPGRVEVQVAAGRVHVRTEDGTEYSPEDGTDYAPEDGRTPWRPLRTLPLPDGTRLLIDDADPLRDCYPVPVAPPLGPGDLAAFAERLRTAYALLDERQPGRRDDVNALLATTVTPLVAGSGVRLGAHGLGAVGVAVDVDPEEFVRELPRTGRLARLTALRETADLNVPGNRAGRLLDEASRELGNATYWRGDDGARAGALKRAGRALEQLAARPEGELTETGAVLAEELRAEWEDYRA